MTEHDGNERNGFSWPSDAEILRQSFTRRRFLEMAGLVGAAATLGPLAAACGSSGTPTSSTTGGGIQIAGTVPGPQPVSGGRDGGKIVVGYSDIADSFDPVLGVNLVGWDFISELGFFGSLLAYAGQGGGPMANLTEMPTVSADSKTLTFKLRPGVKFHNGREITADDVKWSWERLLLPATASWGSSYLAPVVGAKAITNGKTKKLDGFEVLDAKSFNVHLEAANFTFLDACSLCVTAPVPPEEVQRLGNKFGKTPVGWGPYKVESFDEAGQRAHLVKFDDYLYKGLPYADEVEMRWGIDAQSLMLQLKNGDIDVIGDGVPTSLLGSARKDPSLSPLLVDIPVLANYIIRLNCTTPPLSDPKVRQALNWAVNQADLIKIMHGAAVANTKPFPAGIAGYTSTFPGYGYDPTKAKQLLQEAGHANGFDLTLLLDPTSPGANMCQVVQQQLAAVGVKVNLESMKATAIYSLAQSGKFSAFYDFWYMIQPTPADWVDTLFITGGSSNYARFSNSEVDQLAKQADASFNETKRNEMYARIEQIIGENPPGIFLGDIGYVAGVGKRIQNFHFRGDMQNYYDRMWLA
jgi:ABC-type transport system substrate-binding protein